ncbi:MAG: ABC1 kinase family protein [Planctomycetota bacterium]
MKISQILRAPRRTRRVAQIARTCAEHGVGFLVARLGIEQHLPAWARIPSMRREKLPDLPVRLANILEKLGPTFVKFGQMLSSRPDLLPPEYIHELQRICHHVTPFPATAARDIIAEELGQPVNDAFQEFDNEPLASGSIAQVHAATLKDGTEIVVKVRRPGIEKTIEDDLGIMEFLADQANKVDEFQPLRLPMLVNEFGRGIRRELNLLTEAASTHKFYDAFKDDERLIIPEVYWDLCTPKVLVMKRVEGVYLSEIADKPQTEELRQNIGELILDRFLTQFFELGSFHADPHMGNILVMEGEKISLIDFGLTGNLGESLRNDLSNFLIALGNKQFELAAEVLGDLGSVPADLDFDEFRSEVASLLDRHYSVPFEKIDLQKAFQETMQVVRKYNVLMPRNFVLLGKSLVTVGGMVNHLAPGINAADLAAPYAKKIAMSKFYPSSIKRAATSNLYHLSGLLRDAPRDLKQLLKRLKGGVMEFAIEHRGLERYLVDLDKTGNRLALSIMLAAIIISSTSILTSELGPKMSVFGWEASGLGLLGYLFGFFLGIWLVIGIFRSGRI